MATTGGPPRFFSLTKGTGATVLLSSCGRGLSRSKDHGRTWEPVIDQLEWVYTFAWESGETFFAACEIEGIQRTDDGGRNWRPTGLSDGTCFSVASIGGRILAGTQGRGLWASTDLGEHWDQVGADRYGDVSIHRIVELSNGNIVLGTIEAGVLVVDADLSSMHDAGLTDSTVFSLAQGPDGAFYAGTKGEGLFKSNDQGANWQSISAGLTDPMTHSLILDDDGTILAGTGAGINRSIDGGATWSALPGDMAARRVFGMLSTDEGLLASSYDGVWLGHEETGAPWFKTDTGLCDDAFSIWVGPNGDSYAGTDSGQLRHSVDAGETWHVRATEAGIAYTFTAMQDGRIAVGSDDGVVICDASATPATTDEFGSKLAGNGIFSLIETDDGHLLAGTLIDGLQRWNPELNAWSRIEDVTHDMAFDLHRTLGGSILVGTGEIVDDGEKYGGVFRSTDGGTTFSAANSPAVTVYTFESYEDGTILAACKRSTIMRSTDDGATWQQLPARGLAEDKTFGLAIDRNGRTYLGAGTHLYYSDDRGDSWIDFDIAALDGTTTFALAAHPSGAVIAATSAGLIHSSDSGMTWSGGSLLES